MAEFGGTAESVTRLASIAGRVLAVLVLGLALGFAPDGLTSHDRASALTSRCFTRELNVVAHEDDDILYMNPDIQHSISQGRCVETVYLTSGEWDGTATMSRRLYATSREKGTQAAYAAMAHVADRWRYGTSVFDGHVIETATLTADPRIELLYLDIRSGQDSESRNDLVDLYTGVKSSITTMVPTGAPAGVVPVTYTKSNVQNTVQAIVTADRPSLIRTQDYLPDPRLHFDHPDHITGAKLATVAAWKYSAKVDFPVSIVAYRDYNINQSPVDLSASQKRRKNDILSVYHPFDSIYAVPYGQDSNAGRMYYRFPVAPTWTVMNNAGRLQAFQVVNGQLMSWQQTAGGSWTSMTSLGNSQLQPGVSIVTSPDGSLQVFAVKQSIGDTGVVTQDVQYTRERAPGGPFSAWVSIGSPGPGSSGVDDISSPEAVVNADGHIAVFVTDSNGNLSLDEADDRGQYGGWVTEPGANDDLIEAPTAILGSHGDIQVFAATVSGAVQRWAQTTPDGPLSYDGSLAAAHAVGTPSVALNADGRPQLFYRDAGSGRVDSVYQQTDGAWTTSAQSLGGEASLGAPAVADAPSPLQSTSRIALLARSSRTGYETISQHAGDGSFSQPWQSVALPYSQFAPSAVVDSAQVLHFLALSQDGALIETTHP